MNPTKKANTKALIGHLDMIRAYADRNTKDVGKEEARGTAHGRTSRASRGL